MQVEDLVCRGTDRPTEDVIAAQNIKIHTARAKSLNKAHAEMYQDCQQIRVTEFGLRHSHQWHTIRQEAQEHTYKQ